jgi:diguanylate cyclase (GGDEF)-like protein
MEVTRDELLRKNRELENNKQELLEMSYTDQLTQLYNRCHLEEVLILEIQRYNRYRIAFSLIMIDIENFKVVDNAFGHGAGERVLSKPLLWLKNKTAG